MAIQLNTQYQICCTYTCKQITCQRVAKCKKLKVKLKRKFKKILSKIKMTSHVVPGQAFGRTESPLQNTGNCTHD